MYLGGSEVLIRQNNSLTSPKDSKQMESFTAELEGITLASSAVSLLIDQFVHKNIPYVKDHASIQYLFTGLESIGIAYLISSVFGKETKDLGKDSFKCMKDIIFSSVSSLDKTINISALSLVALRAITLKFVHDSGIYIDEFSDVKEIVDNNGNMIGADQIDQILNPR